MRQLSGIDTAFLTTETGSTYTHVCSVTLVDPADAPQPLSLDALTTLMGERMPRLPLLRQRLVEVPFGLDRPYWAEDPDFDLEFHVRELALPEPGNDEQLAEQVSRIASRPLDRSRPLWELYLISGLEGGKAALMAKFHHAAVDGVAGAEIMSTILDTTPEPPPAAAPAEDWSPPPIPGPVEMLGRGLVGLATSPRRALDLQQRIARTLPGSTRFYGQRAVDRFAASLATSRSPLTPAPRGRVLDPPQRPAPRLSFNRAIGPHRRWAFGSTSLTELKRVKNAHGVTLNDVVMAVCAGGLRRWLTAKGELPDVPLVVMVPISVRSDSAGGQAGNQVSAMFPPLPTDIADPLERLRAVSESTKAAKEEHAAVSASVLQDVSDFAMPALATRASWLAGSLRLANYLNPFFNLVISNVPGPRNQLYLAGAKVLGYYPVSVVNDGQGLNITVQSYQDSLDIGLTADRDLVPDVWDLMGHLQESIDELVATVPS